MTNIKQVFLNLSYNRIFALSALAGLLGAGSSSGRDA